ncbi:DNA-deoxyinosine glycosylase [Chitinibacter fontanus]|uniref:DNA-deoxyinosine glycosylase n=1 Tax=Chitinibacter fontanus TaxID=1737446 RepID=A0A7D5VB80_9NEIS|nr:DNA-deoxyinosine glycosylase [Chitinibacter fontanus]QLI82799.1 DNA-deoxyinosine glycosylase [Chitinibacter fontanus]
MSLKASFAPIVSPDARILILGSLPGDASLAQGHYYAHPRNAFWPIISEILQIDLCNLAYEHRYAMLRAQQIALWDVIQIASRSGSLDSAISNIQANPLTELTLRLTQLELVVFNGKLAAKHGKKQIPGYIQQAIAPSTSPAYTISISDKKTAWQNIFNAFMLRQA